MPFLKLIANTVWDNSLTVDTIPATSGNVNMLSITTGQRHIVFSSTNDSINYINKTDKLTADCCVLSRADSYTGDALSIDAYTSYSGTVSGIFSTASFAETLIGNDNQDWFLDFGETVSGVEAFGLTVSGGTNTFNKIYFGESIELEFIDRKAFFTDAWESIELKDGQSYLCDQKVEIKLPNMTQADIDFISKNKLTERPIFIYDSSGVHLENKMYHCVMPEIRIVETGKLFYIVDATIYRLRSYA